MRNLSALIVASFLASSPVAQADDSKERVSNPQGSSTSQSSTASASARDGKTEEEKNRKPA
ncbi:MAG TPA: hypothetical protein ENH72_10275 [Pseudomonas sabulinigri]|jgi:hypothetical protein|uniref:Uncharacterized protein n=1 Tax=marine sediment metagenome TaxID=412755 RepID=A0A0F9TL53_9ZZZZ|nr:hypothetical protein [Halopseudomonas sabulinigri]HEC51433.1 hypothetical protein [Halopseudomonas sabulinigri]|tara:strand:- start:4919 stop:5101 length:183 start_codon:yes stop_codon:yes gene_type:complete